MTFMEIALDLVARGFHVLPLKPRDKFPIVSGGCHAASADEAQIRAWWIRTPQANIGIGCGASNKAVLDIDHGLSSLEDFHSWRMRNGLPETFTVRTGRRPEFGIQMIFDGAMPDVGDWELDGCSGQVKSFGGLVVAAGSIHPDSGETYQVICDMPCAPTPDKVRQLKSAPKPGAEDDGGPITENRNIRMFSLAQKARHALRLGYDALLVTMEQVNETRVRPPLEEEELKTIVRSACNYELGAEPPTLTIGGKTAPPEQPKDWRLRYHSFDEMNNAPKPTFLIDGFLQKDVITAIAAPVGQRKTIVAFNVVHAVLTGEPLFGHFAVTQRAARVLYLCPEMGLLSFADRMRNLGLLPYVGKTLFCRTMNSEGHVMLTDLTTEELTGAIVVIDTAVRFVIGDENSSEDMKVFAENCFGLMKSGAASVVVLFHSPKGTKEASELTLENAMRGSGDLGAFVSSCWATRLQDPDNDEWQSPSYMKNVKQRDFKSKPFEVTSDELGRLHIVGTPGNVRLSTKDPGSKPNKDGREAEALAVIRANTGLSLTS